MENKKLNPYKNEKCTASRQYTSLITKIQVYALYV